MKTHGPLDKVIVTAALTGVLATRKQCPYLPYSPAEIALEAQRAFDAGASIVHIHAREEDGAPSWRAEVFQEIAEKVRSLCPVLLNFSTGGIGNTIADRAKNLPLTRPHMAALNMGSMNYAIYSKSQKKFHVEDVFLNPFSEIEFLLRQLKELHIMPELECFDSGHICNAFPFIDMGLLKAPFHFSLIMGVVGGISASPENLQHQVRLLPEDSHWQLIGIGKDQWPLLEKSLEWGGHIRVGLEDNFYLPSGEMARSNGELVDHAVKMLTARGQKACTVEETRAFLHL